ncbi:MAG: ribosome silencing factor [Isosphaeraceae bacterium]
MTELDPTPTPPADPPESPPVTATSSDVRRRRARREHESQDDVPHTAASRSNPERAGRALENARLCARIADHNRARDILLLDMRNATSFVDFFVIATAASRRQSHGIADEVDQEMKRRGERKLGIEGSEEGRWVLIDYGDFVVHVFSAEARAFYGLEDIWGDAERLEWAEPGSSPAESSNAAGSSPTPE